MKKLFIYFSLTGNGDAVADALREKGYDVRRISAQKPWPKSFAGRILAGGFLAGIGAKTKLADYDRSLEGYDRVVIGSPIWNGRLASPTNTLLRDLAVGERALTFVLYAGGGEAPKACARLAKEYPAANVILLKEPLKHPNELAKLDVL